MKTTKWCERFRRLKYRGGHHVHSPFVFQLIECAIEGREMTYRLEQLLDQTTNRKSYYALLYRLVRHLEVAELSFIGNPSVDEIRFVQGAIETTDRKRRTLFVVTNDCSVEAFEEVLPTLRKKTTDETIVMVGNLFDSRTAQQIWARLAEELPVRTSIDVMEIGFVLFDPTLHEQTYKLYF